MGRLGSRAELRCGGVSMEAGRLPALCFSSQGGWEGCPCYEAMKEGLTSDALVLLLLLLLLLWFRS